MEALIYLGIFKDYHRILQDVLVACPVSADMIFVGGPKNCAGTANSRQQSRSDFCEDIMHRCTDTIHVLVNARRACKHIVRCGHS